jgi:hypothetical protein
VYFTVRNPPPPSISDCPVVGVNYDFLTEDLEVGRYKEEPLILKSSAMSQLAALA